jgi:protein TonB
LPSPEPASPAPPQKIYVMPGEGQMAVNPGDPNGSATGRPDGVKGGTGHTGGETLPPPSGNGPPKPTALAALKTMPEPIGDYDVSKDYPDEARKLEIEGQVTLRLLVDAEGKVAEVKLVKGLGHGLDERALSLGRQIRFRPARDDAGQAVATWIPWTFTYKLPR